jgi:5-methylcytosine-specific restriction endonuclease McrA
MMNYQCANPDCDSGYNVEGHHITPISCGGDDSYWNLIALCKRCHGKFRKVSRLGTKRLELYVFKSMHELNLHGYTLDEHDEDFELKFREMRKSNIVEAL